MLLALVTLGAPSVARGEGNAVAGARAGDGGVGEERGAKRAGERGAKKRKRVSVRRSARRVTRAVAAPAPRWTAPRGTSALANDLQYMLASRVRRGDWGVIVVSLTRGDTL